MTNGLALITDCNGAVFGEFATSTCGGVIAAARLSLIRFFL
jgi:hypothetical protein